MTSTPGRIVVLGAGPTGLGAAYRLQELGHTNFTVIDARPNPGGLASSYRDERGFTWDVGGHVHFSHYDYYDRMIEAVLGEDRNTIDRQAWIWLKQRFSPYPLQLNLRHLPREDRDRAVADLERAVAGAVPGRAENLQEWIVSTFGTGIAELFMIPYNKKVWGHPLDGLGVSWIAERVAVPDLDRVKRNIASGNDDAGWGPNSRFMYPKYGGTGEIWRRVAEGIPARRLHFSCPAVHVDVPARRLHLANGSVLPYDVLISSAPVTWLCRACAGLDESLQARAAQLVHSSVHLVGIGLSGMLPERLVNKCWMYFPSPNSPYYRVTVLSNYSPHLVPPASWSLLAEVTETEMLPRRSETIVAEVERSLWADQLIPPGVAVASRWHWREEFGYPTPTANRDEILDDVIPALERFDIYSRGRFGIWRYEVSNQDHTFMQGVELVDRLFGVGEEITAFDASAVNVRHAGRQGGNR